MHDHPDNQYPPPQSGYPNPPPPGPIGHYPSPPPPGPIVHYPSPPPPGPIGYYPSPPPPPDPTGYPPPPNTNYPNDPAPQGPQGGYPPPTYAHQQASVGGIPVMMSNPIQAPPAQQYGNWSTGLCDCFSDIPSCLLACFCPCVAFGRLSEIVDNGTTTCGCNGTLYGLLCSLGGAAAVFGVPMSFAWIYSCTYRGKIKQQYMNMPPNCCEDCCIHFCCEPCALSQEYRELQNRGYDLSIGWHGNEEKKRQQGGLSAPRAVNMAR